MLANVRTNHTPSVKWIRLNNINSNTSGQEQDKQDKGAEEGTEEVCLKNDSTQKRN